jgi:hypothetical protein
MRSPAQQATANAISFEVKKDGLQQRQSGDWVLRLTVQAIDMDQHILTAPMGTRFACVLVEVNDDETPVDHRAEDRDKWRALGAAKQAGIRCKDPVFWAFLREQGLHGQLYENVFDEFGAACMVRDACGVLSRSDLAKPGFTDAKILWFDLDTKFQAWKAREHG